jgi:hypothetical protein
MVDLSIYVLICLCWLYGKISRKQQDLFAHIAVFLCIQKAATHDIIHWNITKRVLKISYFYLS